MRLLRVTAQRARVRVTTAGQKGHTTPMFVSELGARSSDERCFCGARRAVAPRCARGACAGARVRRAGAHPRAAGCRPVSRRPPGARAARLRRRARQRGRHARRRCQPRRRGSCRRRARRAAPLLPPASRTRAQPPVACTPAARRSACFGACSLFPFDVRPNTDIEGGEEAEVRNGTAACAPPAGLRRSASGG